MITKESQEVLLRLSNLIRDHHRRVGNLDLYGAYAKKIINSSASQLPDNSRLAHILRNGFTEGRRSAERASVTQKEHDTVASLITRMVYRESLCPGCAAPLAKNKKSFMKPKLSIKFCSTKCMANDLGILERRQATMVDRYGVPHPLKSRDIKIAMQDTCLKRYGSSNPSGNESVKAKKKETLLRNYGVDNPSRSTRIQKRKVKTSVRKYGTKSPNQSELVKQKSRDTCLERYGEETTGGNPERLAKVAATWSLRTRRDTLEANKKRKDTSFARFGVEHPMQLEDVARKVKRSSFTYKEVTIKGKKIR